MAAIDEQVKLIGTPGSLFTSRVEWALSLKGISYEYHEENLLHKSPLLLNSNPIHNKVPVLIHKGYPTAESLIILEYIDETWKHRPLLPQDPFERSQARFWAKLFDEKCILAVWKACLGEPEEREKAVATAKEVMGLAEKQIKGKGFFNGEEIGYMDVVLGWMTHWMSSMEELGGIKILDPEEFPALKEWTENFIQVPAIQKSTIPREIVFGYFKGTIDYMQSLSAAKD